MAEWQLTQRDTKLLRQLSREIPPALFFLIGLLPKAPLRKYWHKHNNLPYFQSQNEEAKHYREIEQELRDLAKRIAIKRALWPKPERPKGPNVTNNKSVTALVAEWGAGLQREEWLQRQAERSARPASRLIPGLSR